MNKPQPSPGDNGLYSFCLGPSPFSGAGYPVHIMPSSPQWSKEVAAAIPGGGRRPGQGGLLEGAWLDTPRGLLTWAGLEGTRKSWLFIPQVFIGHPPDARQRVTEMNCTDVALFMECRV